MTCIKVAALFFVLVNCVRAEQFNGTTIMNSSLPINPIGAAPHVPQFDGLTGLLQALGLGNHRSMDMAIVQQMLTSFMGILATGRFMPFIAPMLVQWLVLPLMKIVKTAAKGLLLLGVMGWLVSAVVPALLGYLGLAGASAFVARTFDTSFLPFGQYLPSFDPSNLAEGGLRYLSMDSQPCRMQLSCRAGEFLNDNYPSFTNLLKNSGVIDYVESQVRSMMDPLAGIALDVLQGRSNCQQLPICESLSSIEFYLDPERIANATRNGSGMAFGIPETTPAPITTSTTPFPNNNDLVVNAIKRLAANYYSFS
jgi:hypothetical protein